MLEKMLKKIVVKSNNRRIKKEQERKNKKSEYLQGEIDYWEERIEGEHNARYIIQMDRINEYKKEIEELRDDSENKYTTYVANVLNKKVKYLGKWALGVAFVGAFIWLANYDPQPTPEQIEQVKVYNANQTKQEQIVDENIDLKPKLNGFEYELKQFIPEN